MYDVINVALLSQDRGLEAPSNCKPENALDSQLFKLLGDLRTITRDNLLAKLSP